jgi:hypothetical protein
VQYPKFRNVRNTKLPQSAKTIYTAIADHASRAGTCFPSIRTIAVACSCSERTVQRYIPMLIKEGWICLPEGKSTGRGRTTKFHVHTEAHACNYGKAESVSVPVEVTGSFFAPEEKVTLCAKNELKGDTTSNAYIDSLEVRKAEEVRNTDLDSRAETHKNRESQPASPDLHPLREVLEEPHQAAGNDLGPLSEKMLNEIYAAGGGRSVSSVIEAIRNRRRAGFVPGHRHAPRCWSWYKTAVPNYFIEIASHHVPIANQYERPGIDESCGFPLAANLMQDPHYHSETRAN